MSTSALLPIRRRSLVVIFLTIFIDLLGFGIVIPLLAFFARQYGATGKTVGIVVGVYSLMQFIFSPMWGRLSDRIGRRPVLLISLAGSVIGYTLFAFSRDLVALFVARMIAGIAAANIGTAQAYIADSTTPENRARGMGLIGAAFGLGFILGPPVGGLLSHVGTTHHLPGNLLPGLAAAALSLTALLIALSSLEESRSIVVAPRRRMAPQFDPEVWKSIATAPGLRIVFITFFLIILAFSGMETTVTLFGRDRFNFTARDLGYFFGFMGIIVASIQGGGIGALTRRFGERRLVLAGAAFLAVGFALVPAVENPRMLYFVAILIALGQGMSYPSLSSLTSRTSGPGDHGSMLGMQASIGSLARIIGPLLAGFIYDAFGNRGPFFSSAILSAMAFVMALGLVRPAAVSR